MSEERKEAKEMTYIKFQRNRELDDMLYGAFIINGEWITLEELLNVLNKEELKLLIERIKDMINACKC